MNPLESMLQTQAALEKVSPKLSKLKQSCTELEAEFMKTMVSLMRKSTGQVHFGKDFGGDYYSGMMDDSLSKMLAEKEPMGIAAAIYNPVANKMMNAQLRKQATAEPGVKEDTKVTEDMKH